MIHCEAKHTKPQVPDDEFLCPKCGKGPERAGLVIGDSAEYADPECDLLHVDDLLTCESCGYGATGREFTREWMKVKNIIPCPVCKGTGMVQGKAK